MDALCLVVAGVVQATLPGPAHTLAWTHSVQKTRWEEHYRVERGTLRLVAARAEGSGAGLEPPPDARREGRAWAWHPDRIADGVVLAASDYTADYELCTGTACRPLRALVSAPGPIALRACAADGP